MATSGVYIWTPTLANLIDEAAERAGLNPSTLTYQHLVSARNSLNYLFRELETEHIDQFYRIDRESTAVSAAATSTALASGSVEVMQVWLRESGSTTDMPVTRISREDYNAIADKTATGTPTMYYINHESLNAPTIVLYPIPSAAITLYYDRMRYVDDATALSNTPDAHRLWYDVLAYGLAMRLAEKYNEAKFGLMKGRFDETREKVKGALIERGPILIYGARNRRRRA